MFAEPKKGVREALSACIQLQLVAGQDAHVKILLVQNINVLLAGIAAAVCNIAFVALRLTRLGAPEAGDLMALALPVLNLELGL